MQRKMPRQKLEEGVKFLKNTNKPKERFSSKFFSEEKYHYSQNFQIEDELKVFKQEIEHRFAMSKMNQEYTFPRIVLMKPIVVDSEDDQESVLKPQALQGRQNSVESLKKTKKTNNAYKLSQFNTLQTFNFSKGMVHQFYINYKQIFLYSNIDFKLTQTIPKQLDEAYSSISTKARNDKKKTKYKNKLSALIKGLSSVTTNVGITEKDNLSSHQYLVNQYLTPKNCAPVSKSKNNSKTRESYMSSKDKVMMKQNYSLENLSSNEESLTNTLQYGRVKNPAHKY